MKTTVDIPDMELEDAIKFTGSKTKRAAILTALADFNRRQRMASLVRYSGRFTDLRPHEEMESLEMREGKKR
jgi:hypothetical protein